MIYQLRFRPGAKKELNKLAPQIYERVLVTLNELTQNPYIGKKLEGKRRGHYSVRVWPYRIIYLISKDILLVLIVRIAHRQSVYKGL